MGVVVIGSHPCTRMALSELIESQTSLTLKGETATADQGICQIKRERPDLVISDLEPRQGCEGADFLRAIKTLPWSPRIMVFSASRDPAEVLEALSSGADSFVHKSTPMHEVLLAIEKTGRGESVLLLERDAAPEGQPLQRIAWQHELTEREGEVLLLLLRRLTNEEIADELVLARQTVKNHVSRIFRKLGVDNRHGLRGAIRQASRSTVDAAGSPDPPPSPAPLRHVRARTTASHGAISPSGATSRTRALDPEHARGSGPATTR